MNEITSLTKASTTNGQITRSELFRQYNRMRAAARRAGDVKKIDRLNKALGILQSKAYYQEERLPYTPTAETCGCKDWEFRNTRRRGYTGPCKHIITEEILAAIYAERDELNVTELIHEARRVLVSSY